VWTHRFFPGEGGAFPPLPALSTLPTRKEEMEEDHEKKDEYAIRALGGQGIPWTAQKEVGPAHLDT